MHAPTEPLVITQVPEPAATVIGRLHLPGCFASQEWVHPARTVECCGYAPEYWFDPDIKAWRPLPGREPIPWRDSADYSVIHEPLPVPKAEPPPAVDRAQLEALLPPKPPPKRWWRQFLEHVVGD